MMAILHSKKHGTSSRGDRVPESVASKYTSAGKPGGDAPESKHKEEKGGRWDGKKKKDLKKSLEAYIEKNGRQAAGCLVLNKEGQILLGKRADSGQWATPGGHVDGMEDFQEAALRELREEAGLVGKDPKELMAGNYHGYNSRTFLIESFRGKVKSNGELMALQWFFPHELPWADMTQYTHDACKTLLKQKLAKSRELTWLAAEEELNKNIIRTNAPANTVYQLTHGDALKIVGNSTFRFLRNAVKGMNDEDIKDIQLDHYTIHIRKHVNDVYSGRITDGHKQVHQFTNRSLPAAAAELMSIFEWYLPEDEGELNLLDENDLPDDAIEGGLDQLTENYRKHNIVNIYHEMENIREEIRHGNAVDLQQVEQKIMKLFDKLESNLLAVADKHNDLGKEAGAAIDEIEKKLQALQAKVDELNKKPVTVEAFSASPENDKQIHQEYYSYLSKPQVTISPSGHITISFSNDWTHMDRGNFLSDMKARIVKKAGK